VCVPLWIPIATVDRAPRRPGPVHDDQQVVHSVVGRKR
jgi:hypothetical protein